MQLVKVTVAGGGYEVRIGGRLETDLPGLLRAAGVSGSVVLVTDENVARLHGEAMGALARITNAHGPLHVVGPGEASKSVEELTRLWDRLAADRVDRDGFLIAVGGGVVSDLTGFAAATWMRGVRWGAVPTTMEAAVDAGVGGKTGINRPAGKNLVGAFHQPSFVLVDLALLATLPERDWRAGLAESVKHGLIADAAFFEWQEEHLGVILAGDRDVLEELIARNCGIKARVVGEDEREEKGLREALNYGHTIGHAVEGGSGYQMRHGESIGLGMLAAARIAVARGMLGEPDEERIRRLLAGLGLPTKVPAEVSQARAVELIGLDKKRRSGTLRFVLLEGIGRCRVVEDVTDAEIEAGMLAIA
ncbi:MAG: 3-dehydroquinate synthase [Phycisphaerales bacterium]|nr:MAG: 3-dehydroquinate synthase [Phycisphaerales bacterium]